MTSENEPRKIHATVLMSQGIYQVLFLIMCPKQPKGMKSPGYSPTNRSLTFLKCCSFPKRGNIKMTPPHSAHLFLIYNELASYLPPAETKLKPYRVFFLLVLQSMHCREEAGSPFLAAFLTICKFICLYMSPNAPYKNKVKRRCDWGPNFITKTGRLFLMKCKEKTII